MTGGVKLVLPATTLNEAVLAATDKWRVLVEDPEATLPWSTNIEFYEEGTLDVENGRMQDGPVRMMAMIRIEFDRQLVEELTGSGNAV